MFCSSIFYKGDIMANFNELNAKGTTTSTQNDVSDTF